MFARRFIGEESMRAPAARAGVVRGGPPLVALLRPSARTEHGHSTATARPQYRQGTAIARQQHGHDSHNTAFI